MARAFYDGLLGIREVAKPPRLAVRGGCWFEDGDLTAAGVGVEAEEMEGYLRVYIHDPFGNRLELLEPR